VTYTFVAGFLLGVLVHRTLRAWWDIGETNRIIRMNGGCPYCLREAHKGRCAPILVPGDRHESA